MAQEGQTTAHDTGLARIPGVPDDVNGSDSSDSLSEDVPLAATSDIMRQLQNLQSLRQPGEWSVPPTPTAAPRAQERKTSRAATEAGAQAGQVSWNMIELSLKQDPSAALNACSRAKVGCHCMFG